MWRRRRERGNGQGLVEFALVFPVLVVLVLGIFDLGRAIFAYSTIADVARTASRVAIVDESVDVNGLYIAQNVGENQAVGIQIPANTIVVTWREADLSAVCSPLKIGCVAEVTVPYSFTAITPIIGALVGEISMSQTTRLPVERVYCGLDDSVAPCNQP